MALPSIPLPKGSVEIGGVTVEYRSLSRKEAIGMTEYKDDPDTGEAFLIACGMDASMEEAQAWRSATHPMDADILVKAIARLSGLLDDPKA